MNQPKLLFSVLTGRANQMAIVASTESRAQQRTVYMPPANGMAHRSHLSPDGKKLLVVEMDFSVWLPCRLLPYDGSSSGKRVGPAPAQCTDAAWTPDGRWMYFSAKTGDSFHIWRQRFPGGSPEQITFGATEEDGVEFAPDGRSFLTSIGTRQSTLWIHDSRGDRQATSEGYAFFPPSRPMARSFTIYCARKEPEEHWTNTEEASGSRTWNRASATDCCLNSRCCTSPFQPKAGAWCSSPLTIRVHLRCGWRNWTAARRPAS